MADGSTFVAHEPCPACGSKDNLARYDDGHGHCFGCGHYVNGEGDTQGRARVMAGDLIDPGETMRLAKRKLTQETCQKFGYSVAMHKGKTVQVAAYLNQKRELVAQKLRTAGKDFLTRGDLAEGLPLWGQWLWRDAGKMVVVTEGEIDAMSVSQAQGNKWPVVSVPNGAQGAKKSVSRAVEWLSKYDSVIFMFDDDAPGRKAAAECAEVLPTGKGKIAVIEGYKDANEALIDGKPNLIVDAIWGAKEFRPDGILQAEDLFEEAMKPIPQGLPWWMPSLTEATHGRRPGELYTFGAATGAGKTDWFTQQAAFDITQLNERVGLVFLESPPVELVRRLAGKIGKEMYHIPLAGGDASWRTDMVASLEALRGKVSIYDNRGETDYDVIESRMRYMVAHDGVKMLYIDHLTGIADPNDERASLEVAMKGLASFASETGVMIHIVSHLATPEGRPHEEGGRVMLRHFRGSRTIGFWSHFAFGMERHQQADDEEERKLTRFRILKNRLTGANVGRTYPLSYDHKTGMMFETTEIVDEADSPF